MTFLSINGINNTPGIMGAREETEKVNSHNIVNNTISKIDIFLLLIEIIY
jgi:hypothetical protein